MLLRCFFRSSAATFQQKNKNGSVFINFLSVFALISSPGGDSSTDSFPFVVAGVAPIEFHPFLWMDLDIAQVFPRLCGLNEFVH